MKKLLFALLALPVLTMHDSKAALWGSKNEEAEKHVEKAKKKEKDKMGRNRKTASREEVVYVEKEEPRYEERCEKEACCKKGRWCSWFRGDKCKKEAECCDEKEKGWFSNWFHHRGEKKCCKEKGKGMFHRWFGKDEADCGGCKRKDCKSCKKEDCRSCKKVEYYKED